MEDRQTDYRKFILLSRSRSGSNLLNNLIAAHPNAVAEGELFARTEGRPIEQIFDGVFKAYPAGIRAVGFKIFYYHPLDDSSGQVWDQLLQIKDLRVIHLTRKNILRTLISRKIAEKTDIWMQSDSCERIPLLQRRVSFTQEELIQGFHETSNWERCAELMFRDHERLNLVYEELVRDPEGQLLRVTDFLGLAKTVPGFVPVRQNPEPSSELIVNFEELSSRFASTEWVKFFSE